MSKWVLLFITIIICACASSEKQKEGFYSHCFIYADSLEFKDSLGFRFTKGHFAYKNPDGSDFYYQPKFKKAYVNKDTLFLVCFSGGGHWMFEFEMVLFEDEFMARAKKTTDVSESIYKPIEMNLRVENSPMKAADSILFNFECRLVTDNIYGQQYFDTLYVKGSSYFVLDSMSVYRRRRRVQEEKRRKRNHKRDSIYQLEFEDYDQLENLGDSEQIIPIPPSPNIHLFELH